MILIHWIGIHNLYGSSRAFRVTSDSRLVVEVSIETSLDAACQTECWSGRVMLLALIGFFFSQWPLSLRFGWIPGWWFLLRQSRGLPSSHHSFAASLLFYFYLFRCCVRLNSHSGPGEPLWPFDNSLTRRSCTWWHWCSHKTASLWKVRSWNWERLVELLVSLLPVVPVEAFGLSSRPGVVVTYPI